MLKQGILREHVLFKRVEKEDLNREVKNRNAKRTLSFAHKQYYNHFIHKYLSEGRFSHMNMDLLFSI